MSARSHAWWGMALVVATEATLFAVLLASYFYLRWQSDSGWPPAGLADPDLLRPTAMTAILLISAAPMAAALRGVRRDRRAALTRGLTATLLLGAAFVGLQAWDLAAKTADFTPQDGAYASLLYTISGAHAAHAVVGLMALAWVQGRAWRGTYDREAHVGVSVWALYWYFVVALAVVVWVALFLTPRI